MASLVKYAGERDTGSPKPPVFTGNMASCHFLLADLRRLVLTRPSGPDLVSPLREARGYPCR
jgi:hypothetical protein